MSQKKNMQNKPKMSEVTLGDVGQVWSLNALCQEQDMCKI